MNLGFGKTKSQKIKIGHVFPTYQHLFEPRIDLRIGKFVDRLLEQLQLSCAINRIFQLSASQSPSPFTFVFLFIMNSKGTDFIQLKNEQKDPKS